MGKKGDISVDTGGQGVGEMETRKGGGLVLTTGLTW